MFENIYVKLLILNVPYPAGVRVFMPYLMIKNTAPKIIRKIETNLTTMMIAWRTLVFSIELKLNAAPERKNKPSQNLY